MCSYCSDPYIHYTSYPTVLSFSSFSLHSLYFLFFFFFNDTATTEIYTLSLHDALPILRAARHRPPGPAPAAPADPPRVRSEEHTSELQSQSNLVCRLLLEKKKKKKKKKEHHTRKKKYIKPKTDNKKST